MGAVKQKLIESLTGDTDIEKASPAFDPITKSESNELDKAEREAKLKELLYSIEARKKYAKAIFISIALWLVAILVVVICVGASILTIADSVLITLLSTTTLNVIGLLLVVVNYLFPKQSM